MLRRKKGNSVIGRVWIHGRSTVAGRGAVATFEFVKPCLTVKVILE